MPKCPDSFVEARTTKILNEIYEFKKVLFFIPYGKSNKTMTMISIDNTIIQYKNHYPIFVEDLHHNHHKIKIFQ